MGKLIIQKTSKEEGSFEVPSARNKLASVTFLTDKKGKKYFIVKNKNYASNSYLKNKVKNLVENEFNKTNLEVFLARFASGEQIYSTPTNKYEQGDEITLLPDFKNYLSAGVVECSAFTVRQPVKVRYEGNTNTTCRGGGRKDYSIYTVL